MTDPLLAECLAARDDDAPRLVWADHAGGSRGELVVVQCDLARGGLAPPASAARRRRQRELLAEHGRDWSGLEHAARCRFRRGFVECAAFASWDLADRLDAILAGAPFLDSIELLEPGSADQLGALFGHPSYSRIRGLGVRALDAAAISRVVETNAFAQLSALDFSIDARVAPAELAPLTRPHHFAGIERLELQPRDDAHAAELLAMMPRLRAVSLVFCRDAASVLPAISPTLVELTVAADALGALAAGSLAAGLERLSLRHVTDTHALRVLAGFPRLRSLDLDMERHPRTHLDASFAELPLPALRELRCNEIERGTALAIAKSIGAQLELFQPGSRFGDDHELQARFAGDFHVSRLVGAGPPLFASERPDAPMWDYPRISFAPRALPDL